MEENQCKMSHTTEEIPVKRLKLQSTDISTEENMCPDKVELMDLPEPVLLHILGSLDHDFLRHVAPRVNKEWKRLAHSQTLWSQASLEVSSHPNLSEVRSFIRNIRVTPYLNSLSVDLIELDDYKKPTILSALVSTRCRIHKLTLSVVHYGSEIVRFLLQHPEIRVLCLKDDAFDSNYSAGVAAAVGHLAPHLLTLDLSLSMLLTLRKAGLLLASPPALHGQCFQEPHGVLDLRNVDNVCEIVKEDKPKGLLELKFSKDFYSRMLTEDPLYANVTTGKYLSALVHAHKQTLKTATFSVPPREDLLMALAECQTLEELSVRCDPDVTGFCAMLQRMGPTLRKLDLDVPSNLDAHRLATVLETLTRHAPRLESLGVHCLFWNGKPPRDLFPGFKPLQALLVAKEGSTGLSSLCIRGMGPIGRVQVLELASMATANAKLTLSHMSLHVCYCCSKDREAAGSECRDNARKALIAAAPSLCRVEWACECLGVWHSSKMDDRDSWFKTECRNLSDLEYDPDYDYDEDDDDDDDFF